MAIYIRKCGCGKVLKSTSISQMKANYWSHLAGKYHKMRMNELEYSQCQRCGFIPDGTDWIVEHHINKVHSDSSKENLAYLCVKCHSYVHSNKNIKKEFLKLKEETK
jgi:5-methylcytosine-specific restriction endonuclease McrA